MSLFEVSLLVGLLWVIILLHQILKRLTWINIRVLNINENVKSDVQKAEENAQLWREIEQGAKEAEDPYT